MMTEEFFKQQTESTKEKLKFYEDYMEQYLIKILMAFGCVSIYDPFCGPGILEDGNKGSPIILLGTIEKLLLDEKFMDAVRRNNNSKDVKIKIFFNDKEQENIDKLKKVLEQYKAPKEISITCLDYKDFFEKTIKPNFHFQGPQFYFLDPFTYSTIDISDIQNIMKYLFHEVLIFVPLSFAYRFMNQDNAEINSFLEQYSEKGNLSKNIHELVVNIRKTIRKKLKIDFVRPIYLQNGSNTYCLFFLTGNINGMHIINDIVYKKDPKGLGFTKFSKELDKMGSGLFGKEFFVGSIFEGEIPKFLDFIKKLILEGVIKNNVDIIKITELNGFPINEEIYKPIKEMLLELEKEKKIQIIRKHKNVKNFGLAFKNYKLKLAIFNMLD